MNNSGRVTRGRLCLLLSAAVLGLGLLGAAPLASAQRGDEVEACKNCHEDYVKTYLGTKHGTAADARTPTCTTCHGQNALEHAKQGGGRGVGGIFGFNDPKVDADQKAQVCLTCHQGGNRLHWQMSLHASRDTTCTSCHQLHTEHDRVRNKFEQAEVCFNCHKEQRVQVRKPSRHPILEGKVTCSDCHNPHGSPGPKNLVRDNVNDTCYSCHMEKRGPFVRTHQPVQEDCSICHNPHGTTTPNLLKARSPYLCQSCHEPTSHRDTPGTPAGTSTSANLWARGCLNCHTNIHGTNNPASISNERTFRR